jgi:putative AlgH/UPF0301 family transcriptional regulator
MSTKQENSVRRVFWPHFLVASPHIRGTAYDRQVVYLVEHNDREAVGLLLDSQCQQDLRRLRDSLTESALRPRPGLSPEASLPVQVVRWSSRKLDQELRYGVWLNGPAEFDRVFGDYDDLWLELVCGIGRSVLQEALQISELPREPWWN